MAPVSAPLPPSAPLRPITSLNDSQRRVILCVFLDLHRKMAEMESRLGASPSPFSQFVEDLAPTESRVVHDYFEQLRARMLTCLEEAGIPLDVHRTGVRWALYCGLIAMHIAVAEMSPGRLRGYGPLDSSAGATVTQIQHEVGRIIDRLSVYLHQRLGHDLAGRLARLDAAPASVELLTALERVITRQALIEFRPQLDQIVRRLEAPRFEIAVFGRVSSGKSSLLNHLAGIDVLPVGVTPITAVPTRLVRGDRFAVQIAFAEGHPRTVPLEELRDYASEEGNPGNSQRVTGILVQAPSPRLREGVVLVDTPGVGSLARSGSAETLAYLPQCDLGVILIDAGSTLTHEDTRLLRLLYEAGVPAKVVLSKADLLAPADRERLAEYIREQARREAGVDLTVHPVSTVGLDESLLTRWFEEEIEPLLGRHRELAEASLHRKIAYLRDSVVAVLETMRNRRQGRAREGSDPAAEEAVVRLLREADEAIREARTRCREWGHDGDALLHEAAVAIASVDDRDAYRVDSPLPSVVERVLARYGRMAYEEVVGLQQSLSGVLDGLAPLGRTGGGPLQEVNLRGLPAPAVSAREGWAHIRCPWWASLSSSLAVWATRRALERRLGAELRELVGAYDQRLRAWLSACQDQLVEAYEGRAEVFREHARRLAGEANHAGQTAPPADVEADLRELRPSPSDESRPST